MTTNVGKGSWYVFSYVLGKTVLQISEHPFRQNKRGNIDIHIGDQDF